MEITEKEINKVESNLNESHDDLCKVLALIFEGHSRLEKEYWWDGFFYKIEEAINSDKYVGSIISYGKGDVGIINDVFGTLQTELKDPVFFSFLKNLQFMAIASDNNYSYEVEKEAEECLINSLQKIKERGSFFRSMYPIKTMAMRRLNDKNWTGGDENPLTLDEIKNSNDE